MAEKEKKDKLALVDGENTGDGVDEHSDLRRTILSLREKADEDYWALGIALCEAYDKSYYRGWGFDSWKEYVEQELDIHLRKAQYLVKLQEWFSSMTPAIQKWMRSLGWTKARMLMSVVTQENAQEWKRMVEGKTVMQIEAMLSASRETGDSGGTGDGVEAAAQSKTLSIKGMHPEMLDLWERACAHAMEVGETEKPCQALNLICIDYLASTTNILTKEDQLKKMEKQLGLKLIAIREEDDAVVYGGDYLDAQEEVKED